MIPLSSKFVRLDGTYNLSLPTALSVDSCRVPGGDRYPWSLRERRRESVGHLGRIYGLDRGFRLRLAYRGDRAP